MSVWMIVASIIAVLVFLLIGFVLGVMYRKKVSEREIASAEDEAKRIINEGIKAAENKKRKKNKNALSSLSDIKPGDYVVHQSHGIGMYAGIQLSLIHISEPTRP